MIQDLAPRLVTDLATELEAYLMPCFITKLLQKQVADLVPCLVADLVPCLVPDHESELVADLVPCLLCRMETTERNHVMEPRKCRSLWIKFRIALDARLGPILTSIWGPIWGQVGVNLGSS